MILITGATDGIGKETAFQLVKKGYNILIHGRNNERLEQIRNQLKEIRNDTKIETVCADFCSLKEVNSMANKIKSNYQEINILINNAGVYEKRLKYSKDEYEMTYAVNFLAHYSLSLQILPVLLNNKQARIINLSSLTHSWAKIDWDNINAEKSYDATNAYSLSKLFNLQFSNELHRHLIDKEICINAVHPGVIDTKLLRAGWGGGARIEYGAETSIYLATKTWDKNDSGKYWDDKRAVKCSVDAQNKELAQKLFTLAELQTGVKWPL